MVLMAWPLSGTVNLMLSECCPNVGNVIFAILFTVGMNL